MGKAFSAFTVIDIAARPAVYFRRGQEGRRAFLFFLEGCPVFMRFPLRSHRPLSTFSPDNQGIIPADHLVFIFRGVIKAVSNGEVKNY